MQTKRQIALNYAWTWLGRPYIWGGDDPAGIDCSGLVIEILKAVGVLPETYDGTAEDLWQKFRTASTTTPEAGDLIFYQGQAGRMVHVGLVLDGGLVLHAAGGGSGTTTQEQAWKQNAFVKIRPISYRQEKKFFVKPYGPGE